MDAIILAAGRGNRMRPLTDHTPKPLLQVRGKPLIEWHIEALVRSGVSRIVINTAWLEEQILATLGDGSRFGVEFIFSQEGRDHGQALETAGGLKKAMLPILQEKPAPKVFWYVAADVYMPEFIFSAAHYEQFISANELIRLWLVPNPPQHPKGDFALENGKAIHGQDGTRMTWSGVAMVRDRFITELMNDLPLATPAPLKPYLDRALNLGLMGAQVYLGFWADVGTPERLEALQN